MTAYEAGKGDAPRKQQDQKAYEEGWDRIFRRRPKDEDFRKKYEDGELLGKAIKEEPLKEDENDD